MLLGFTYYQLLWYFIAYAFTGWCVEVIFAAAAHGKIVNRGFLNGPVCPIYGFGMVGVLLLAKAVPDTAGDAVSLPILFFGGMFLASAIELIGGWLMDKLFHARWWDYRDRPFNLGGYICLEFSLIWGLGIVLAVRVVHPLIARGTGTAVIPERFGWPILGILYLALLSDFAVTLMTIAKLNKDLKELDQIDASLRIVSDALSDKLGEGALLTGQKLQEGRVKAELAREDARKALELAGIRAVDALADAKSAAEDLKAQQKASLERKAGLLRARIIRNGQRISRAFPFLEHRDYRELVNRLKELRK